MASRWTQDANNHASNKHLANTGVVWEQPSTPCRMQNQSLLRILLRHIVSSYSLAVHSSYPVLKAPILESGHAACWSEIPSRPKHSLHMARE